jgi:iron complex outermembrane receptor protein
MEVIGTRTGREDPTTLKLPTKVLETPRSVTVIDDSRIRAQNFRTAADLLFWVPGVNSNGDSYHFYARGYRMLPSDWKVDGFQGRIIGGSYAPLLFGYESVVFLKGPASLLYGASSSPGGQISLVTKKPSSTPATTTDLRFSSFDGGGSRPGDDLGTQFSLDSTGPLGSDKRLLYRFLTLLENAAPRPGLHDNNQFYRASTTLLLDKAGLWQLTPMLEWSRETRAIRSSALSPSSSLATNDGRTDYTLADISTRSTNLSAGSRRDDNLTTGTDLNAHITGSWKANASLRYHRREYKNDAWTLQTATLAQGSADDPYSWTIKRRHGRAQAEYEDFGLDANTTWEFLNASEVQSLLQAGLNGRTNNTYSYTASAGKDQSPVNIYSGLAQTPLIADASARLPRSGLTKTFTWNTYLQSQTRFHERFILTLSGAFAGDRTRSFLASGPLSTDVTRSSALKPNAALVWLINSQLTAYVSYSTSYNLPDATYEDAQGQKGGFSPTEGENYELGLKSELVKGLLTASTSVFDTALNNVLVQSSETDLNPNLNRYYTQTNTGRASKGAELELTLSPVKAWTNNLTYAYIDAYNRNLDGSRGPRAEMTPRHAVSLFSRYEFASGLLKGFAATGGFIWQTERIGGSSAATTAAPDPLRLRPFHRFDAGVSYRWQSWTASLNVENLANATYALAGSTGLNLELANPRTYTLRLSRTW